MTASLPDLIAQREALERQIREAQRSAKQAAIGTIKTLMAEHGLTASDLVAKDAPKSGSKIGSKVAAKYRDPDSGLTWTGRGLKPKWLSAAIAEGKSPTDFLI